MKKITTLFERIYENHEVVGITPNVTDGMSWVQRGLGVATVKIDGSCTAIIGGNFYKRYDAKKGKKPPEGAIPCCDPDPVTGHWPHWVLVNKDIPGDKWYWEAYQNALADGTITEDEADWTFEAVGPHFQNNPYNLPADTLEPHGRQNIRVGRSFDGIKQYLTEHEIEGIVFWLDGEPRCKIKRSDFGLPWPVK